MMLLILFISLVLFMTDSAAQQLDGKHRDNKRNASDIGVSSPLTVREACEICNESLSSCRRFPFRTDYDKWEIKNWAECMDGAFQTWKKTTKTPYWPAVAILVEGPVGGFWYDRAQCFDFYASNLQCIKCATSHPIATRALAASSNKCWVDIDRKAAAGRSPPVPEPRPARAPSPEISQVDITTRFPAELAVREDKTPAAQASEGNPGNITENNRKDNVVIIQDGHSSIESAEEEIQEEIQKILHGVASSLSIPGTTSSISPIDIDQMPAPKPSIPNQSHITSPGTETELFPGPSVKLDSDDFRKPFPVQVPSVMEPQIAQNSTSSRTIKPEIVAQNLEPFPEIILNTQTQMPDKSPTKESPRVFSFGGEVAKNPQSDAENLAKLSREPAHNTELVVDPEMLPPNLEAFSQIVPVNAQILLPDGTPVKESPIQASTAAQSIPKMSHYVLPTDDEFLPPNLEPFPNIVPVNAQIFLPDGTPVRESPIQASTTAQSIPNDVTLFPTDDEDLPPNLQPFPKIIPVNILMPDGSLAKEFPIPTVNVGINVPKDAERQRSEAILTRVSDLKPAVSDADLEFKIPVDVGRVPIKVEVPMTLPLPINSHSKHVKAS